MAMAEAASQAHDRPGRLGRRRPFSALMKKLANLKAASSGDGGRHAGSKRGGAKRQQNNPYQSGRVGLANSPQHSRYSVSSSLSRRRSSLTSLAQSDSVRLSVDEQQPPPTTGGRSMAPTVSTDHETAQSMTAPSHGASSITGTSRTANGRRGGDSCFSSPAPSVRSLTTTLTTIQTSIAPNAGGGGTNTNTSNPQHHSTTTHNHHQHHHHHHHHSHHSGSQVIHFNQPFPTTASPASAIPAHLAASVTGGGGHPTTYATATANNLLTDNASILTLASSSKRRRRRSFDTDASVRALAPSSLWGGSRESLPLSVLSANMDGSGGAGGGGGGGGASGTGPATPGLHRSGGGGGGGMGGMGSERTSIYSATGIFVAAVNAAAASAAVAAAGGGTGSERNSFYAATGGGGGSGGGGGGVKSGLGTSAGAGAGDAASVRSSLLGHGRTDSTASGSFGGLSGAAVTGTGTGTGTSPLASPKELSEVELEVAEQGVEEKDEGGTKVTKG
ncbi:hypothetical protein VTK26DRAFT_62 [Humicola hyalothermophila]